MGIKEMDQEYGYDVQDICHGSRIWRHCAMDQEYDVQDILPLSVKERNNSQMQEEDNGKTHK